MSDIAVDKKSVIGYRQTPKAPEGAPWNGPREVATADVPALKVICTWFDSKDADNKGGYKLPHHKAGEEHAVVLRGVQAAMGALLGARGGVDIPSGDRAGVYNHLAKHLKEFERDVPDFRAWESMSEAERIKAIEDIMDDSTVDWTKVDDAILKDRSSSDSQPEFDEGEKAVIAKITTDDPDRDLEVVVPRGMNWREFRQSGGSVFYGHDERRYPIGRNLWLRRTPSENPRAIVAKTVMAPTPEGETAFELMKGGFLKGWSVRFLSVDGSPPTEAELKVHPAWAGVRYVHRKTRLLEYSSTGIPANAQAISMAVAKGDVPLLGRFRRFFDVEAMRRLAETPPEDVQEEKALRSVMRAEIVNGPQGPTGTPSATPWNEVDELSSAVCNGMDARAICRKHDEIAGSAADAKRKDLTRRLAGRIT